MSICRPGSTVHFVFKPNSLEDHLLRRIGAARLVEGDQAVFGQFIGMEHNQRPLREEIKEVSNDKSVAIPMQQNLLHKPCSPFPYVAMLHTYCIQMGKVCDTMGWCCFHHFDKKNPVDTSGDKTEMGMKYAWVYVPPGWWDTMGYIWRIVHEWVWKYMWILDLDVTAGILLGWKATESTVLIFFIWTTLPWRLARTSFMFKGSLILVVVVVNYTSHIDFYIEL